MTRFKIRATADHIRALVKEHFRDQPDLSFKVSLGPGGGVDVAVAVTTVTHWLIELPEEVLESGTIMELEDRVITAVNDIVKSDGK